MRRRLIAGNWKLHGLSVDLDWVSELTMHLGTPVNCDLAVCPPATLAALMVQRAPEWLAIAGQDCSAHAQGAHTGEISAAMLADIGCRYVIVGHSERREHHGETCAVVKAKATQALSAGITPIICLGETLQQRDHGQAHDVCERQLADSLPDASAGDIIVAYEPVWAIGTGRTATAQQAQDIHKALRKAFPSPDRDDLRILYGGSVKPENAAEMLAQPDIDGALVGGASLRADSFAAVIDSVE